MANHLDGALLATEDGLVLAEYLPTKIDPDLLAGSLATVLSTMQNTIEDVGKGRLQDAILQASDGCVAASDIGGALLIILAPASARIGVVASLLKKAIEKLKKL